MAFGKHKKSIVKKNSKSYTIYCLKNTIDDAILYVGITELFIWERLSRHISASKSGMSPIAQKIHDIQCSGGSVKIEALCWFSSDYETAMGIERDYISEAVYAGFRLFNGNAIWGAGRSSRGIGLVTWEADKLFIKELFMGGNVGATNKLCRL